MKEIKWGFIGCGEVTEKKSGPAFNEVAGSKVVAVMSRSEDKARSYAERHHIRKWYTDAQELIDILTSTPSILPLLRLLMPLSPSCR